MDGGGASGSVWTRREEEEATDLWARAISEEERLGRYLLGRSNTGPGRLWRLGRILPLGLLLFFHFLFSFLFF
jgi:hypothetical protein